MTTASRSAAASDRTGGIRSTKTKLAAVAVVCSRCAKRQGLRPKDVRALLKAAARSAAKSSAKSSLGSPAEGADERTERGAARAGGRKRKLCVVEARCLGPCPKRAVAVATGTSLAAGRVLLLDPAAGPREALAVLLPEFGPNAGLAAGCSDESSPPA